MSRYKKQKALCEKQGNCEMGGFTRLLHSGEPDNLMDEIPTVVVKPLPKDMVEHSWCVCVCVCACVCVRMCVCMCVQACTLHCWLIAN